MCTIMFLVLVLVFVFPDEISKILKAYARRIDIK